MQFRLVDVYESKPSEAGLMVIQEGKRFVSIFNTGLSAAMTAAQPYTIDYKLTALKHVDVIAPATLITAANLICVPEAAIADDAFGWVQIYGECEAKIGGAGTAGNYLEVINAGTAFITEGAATVTVASAAVQIDTTTAAATATIFLFGKQVGVLAS